MDTRYNESVANVTEDIERGNLGEEDVSSLECTPKGLKKMLVETTLEYSSSGQYDPNYQLLDHVLEEIREIGKLSALDSK